MLRDLLGTRYVMRFATITNKADAYTELGVTGGMYFPQSTK